MGRACAPEEREGVKRAKAFLRDTHLDSEVEIASAFARAIS